MLRSLMKAHPVLWRTARVVRKKFNGQVEREMTLLPHIVPANRMAVDVGGNTGAYCEELVHLAKSVVVIEANPALAKHLNWMFEGKVRVVAAAASDELGEVVLRIPDDPSLGGLATVSMDNPLETNSSVTIPAITLDSLDLHNVGFVKIDVEGHEASVLRGAAALIERERPNLLIEAEERHVAGALAKVRGFLEPRGYIGFMLREGVLRSIKDFDPVVHQDLTTTSAEALDQGHVPTTYVNNFVFLPN